MSAVTPENLNKVVLFWNVFDCYHSEEVFFFVLVLIGAHSTLSCVLHILYLRKRLKNFQLRLMKDFFWKNQLFIRWGWRNPEFAIKPHLSNANAFHIRGEINNCERRGRKPSFKQKIRGNKKQETRRKERHDTRRTVEKYQKHLNGVTIRSCIWTW